MTAFADDPLLAHLSEQTDRLLSTINELTDEQARGPSLLPGWTRGHVLAHLARNADGLGNVARTAITGRVTPMYESAAQRDADIEADADRSASDHESDVEASAERLLALLADIPADRLDVQVPSGRGPTITVATLPWVRLREVVYHHVDLDAGFTMADAPDLVLRGGLAECPARLADATPGATITAQFADSPDERLVIGDGSVAVAGPAHEVLGWLTGRSSGSGLDTGQDDLPALPSWG
ncbi:maleylpyruvate isomerase family mycothiol-dependent enzyme [Angustibacter luteus]|uniref:Maleylpyruvate isomerase family mycothiol-dependent enzyme n=1 Tax=Angustibacter luteus TaxID=658456 RepID=A0ABW1JBC3_9ACTN